MKIIKIASLILCLIAAGSANAAGMDGMQGMSPANPQKAAARAEFTEGEVRTVNKETGKITLKHGEIKNLEMPGMTMVFTAKDKGMLASLNAGDKVKFMVVNEGGKMIVTDIQPAK